MCAITGVVDTSGELFAGGMATEALFAMQHRGAEATGIVGWQEDGEPIDVKGLGRVRDVLNPDAIVNVVGGMALGHNKYSTFGDPNRHWQPVVDKPINFAFAHNGNLPATDKLRRHLNIGNVNDRPMNDSEMMAAAIAQQLRLGKSLPNAVQESYPYFKGAFSCVASDGEVTVAFRDRKGIRPLAIGQFEDGFMVSSETCGLDIVNVPYLREVEPGEMVIFAGDQMESVKMDEGEEKLDIFEFVYFARGDSLLYGKRVKLVRKQSGVILAEEHPLTEYGDNALVIPIPDTSVPAALGYAKTLGLDFDQDIEKNHFVGRTFMAPSQRGKQLRRKHSLIPEPVRGRDVIFVDDSVVRGNTAPAVVNQAREAGAKSVSLVVASPPVRFPDHYGIDTRKQKELPASRMTIEALRDKLGVDYLGFLSLDGLVRATGVDYDRFNLSCFNGKYPIGIGKENKSKIKRPKDMTGVE